MLWTWGNLCYNYASRSLGASRSYSICPAGIFCSSLKKPKHLSLRLINSQFKEEKGCRPFVFSYILDHEKRPREWVTVIASLKGEQSLAVPPLGLGSTMKGPLNFVCPQGTMHSTLHSTGPLGCHCGQVRARKDLQPAPPC